MKKFFSNVLIVLCGTLLVKFSSLFRDMMLTYKYGASYISDAYIVAMTIPNVIFMGITESVGTGFIPVYNEWVTTRRNEENKFFGNILNCMFLISCVICVFVFCFTKEIISILAGGFTQDTLELAVKLARPISLVILILGISGALRSYLQVKNRFFIFSFVAVPTNILISLFIFGSRSVPTDLGWKVFLAYIPYALLLYIMAHREGFQYNFYLNLKEVYLKKIINIIMPLLIVQIIMDIHVLVDKILASSLGSGIITALDYANKINSLAYGLIAASVSTVLFPKIALNIQERKYKKVNIVIQKVVMCTLYICIPLFALMIILSDRIVKILFYRGAFDLNSVHITSVSLQIYLCSMIPMNLRILLEKVYYSMQDTTKPLKISAISIAVNIVLSLSLIHPLGYIGLAIGTSASIWISLLFYWRGLKKTIIEKFIARKRELVKCILSVLIMSIICRFVGVKLLLESFQNILIREIVELLFISALGIVIYLGSLAIFKSEIIVQITKHFQERS